MNKLIILTTAVIVVVSIGIVGIAIFLILAFGGYLGPIGEFINRDKIGSNPSDILISDTEIYILDRGWRKGLDAMNIEYIKPTLWYFNFKKNKAVPFVISEKSSSGCEKIVDLGTSIFISCPDSYVFSKETKSIKKLDNPIKGRNFSTSPTKNSMATALEKEIFLYDKSLKLISSFTNTSKILGSLVFSGGTIIAFDESSNILTFNNKLKLKNRKNLEKIFGVKFDQFNIKTLFADLENPNIIYFSLWTGPFRKTFIYKFDSVKNIVTRSLIDEQPDFGGDILSLQQTQKKIYFLARTYTTGGDTTYEIVLVNKQNLKVEEKFPISLSKGETISSSILVNNSAFAVGKDNIFVLVHDGSDTKVLIYGLDGKFNRSVTLQQQIK